MSDPNHIYLDLDVINNNYNQSGPPPYLRFGEIKNTFFLDGDSAEYFCNIMRFTIQTGNTLPVFIPSVVVGQDDPNKNIFAVSLKYTYQGIEYVSTNVRAGGRNRSDSCSAAVEARLFKQILLCVSFYAFCSIGAYTC